MPIDPQVLEYIRQRRLNADQGISDAADQQQNAQVIQGMGKIAEGLTTRPGVTFYNRFDQMGSAPKQTDLLQTQIDMSPIVQAAKSRQEQALKEQQLAQAQELKAAEMQQQEERQRQQDEWQKANFGLRERQTVAAERQAGIANQLRRDEMAQRKAVEDAKLAKEREPSQAQTNAAGFAKRARDAEKDMAEIAASGYDRGSVSSGLGTILPNALRSSAAQRQDQAERNFVNSILRNESGAAISQSEFDNAAMQYFPRAGDTPEVLQQKQRNREQAIQNLELSGGRATNKLSTPSPLLHGSELP